MQEICKHNQRWFFSEAFTTMISDELKRNILDAKEQIKDKFLTARNFQKAQRNRLLLSPNHNRNQLAQLFWECRSRR